MKFTLNHDTLFDTDDLTQNMQDLFARFSPAPAFSPDTLAHLDDFALRSLLRRTTAKRDTLTDALALIHAEQDCRHTASSAPAPTVPDKW